MSAPSPLADSLARRTAGRGSELVESLPDGRIRCLACGHRCPIPEGREGVCRVRFHRGGTLRVPHGYVGALQCDPIEKKPFFQPCRAPTRCPSACSAAICTAATARTGSRRRSIRDPEAVAAPARRRRRGSWSSWPSSAARRRSCRRYNEPLITREWAVDVFARRSGAGCARAYISNGNGTPQVLDFIRPWVDFYKVDLKIDRTTSTTGSSAACSRTCSTRSRDPRARLLARDRDARRSPASTTPRRSCARGAVPRVGVDRISRGT